MRLVRDSCTVFSLCRYPRAQWCANLPVLIAVIVFPPTANDLAATGLLALFTLWRILHEATVIVVLLSSSGALVGGSFWGHLTAVEVELRDSEVWRCNRG